jgi:hypothetical protein
VTEAVEQLDLLLAVPPHRVIVGQLLDQLTDARSDLVREVRCRRPDERVDVLPGRLSRHGAERSEVQVAE